MKNKKLFVFAILAILMFTTLTTFRPVNSQTTSPTPTRPNTPTLAPDKMYSELETRVIKLEEEQARQVNALQESNAQYQFLLNSLTGFLALIITAGGILQFLQFRREGNREVKQAEREAELDQIQNHSAQQVSRIMEVVRDTLQSRLDAEEEARKEAKQARADFAKLEEIIKPAKEFIESFKETIQSDREAIEVEATKLAQTSRHEFKPITTSLSSFALQFDNFNRSYLKLESADRLEFSRKALYIRGIAALYSDQLDLAKRCLNSVTDLKESEKGDVGDSHKRRLGNAYYYLGIIESNFGNFQGAIDFYEQAKSLGLDDGDFLTKLVNAEAYVMNGVDETNKAGQIIEEVKEELRKRISRGDRSSGLYRRFRSRALIIEANTTYLKHDLNWEDKAEGILQELHESDPSYYYGTYSLAQVYAHKNNMDIARKLFSKAYDTLEKSGDLFITTETRILILLRMVAGICSRQGLMDAKKSDDHLDKADQLRRNLPKLGSQSCTAFSVLSKLNERSEVIHDHIELIRSGKIFLE